MKDLYHDYRTTQIINPIAMTTANANGTVIDLIGYRGVLLVAGFGLSSALLGASNLATVRFMSSSDNSTWAAIADTDLIGGNNTQIVDANAEANTCYQRSYIGSARYVTIRIEPTGTIATTVSAYAVLGRPLHAPIA
jgi:hypothetical protein